MQMEEADKNLHKFVTSCHSKKRKMEISGEDIAQEPGETIKGART